jgi:hypothetical protein
VFFLVELIVIHSARKVSLPLANPNVYTNSVTMLTYILKRFIKHFTQIKFNIIPKSITTSPKQYFFHSTFSTQILCEFLIPRVLYTLCPALLVFSDLIALKILVTEWYLQTSSTLGLYNSVFFPVTCSVLQPIWGICPQKLTIKCDDLALGLLNPWRWDRRALPKRR